MANAALSFDVDDTSPIFTYFPFSDTLSIPDFTAGWNPLFNQTSFGGAPLEVENSTSVHITSLNNASFSLRWKGTGIQLFGYATDASYTILLDGSPRTTNSSDTILASIQNLDNVNHEVSLTTIISDSTQNQTSSFIVFDKATISALASDNTTISSNFTSQSLNDNTISFLGEWSFQNNSASGLGAVHISDNLNDNASAEFNGTALQIFGTVSPEGGNYTVKLDNVTTQFSANTSFTQNNTLLFFASALDPSIGHDVQITNNGGTLILPYNGFVAFSSASPSSPSTGTTPSATSTGGNLSTGSLPKGTIAALVLAGILAFLLSSGLLFFFFVWRPMMIRHRQARRDRYMSELEQDATGRDAVLNIRRHTPSYMFDNSPTGSRRTRGSQKGSNRSGFLRWKREMESTNGEKVLGALGLVFRHSYSPKDKEPSYVGDDDLYKDGFGSQKSSNRSSAGSAHGGKGKGKSRWTGKSKQDAPSYTIDLPPLNRSQENFEQEVPSLLPPPATHTPFSGFTSLTYMSTPDTNNSRELSFNPPSSHINTSRPQSPDYGKADSNGALLIHDEFNRQARPEETPSEVDFRSSIISTHQEPDLQVHVQEFEVESTNPTFSSRRSESRRAASMYAREMDRGSVRTNDDGLSMLGPATVRAAIRSLSPRTSELAFTNLALNDPVTLAAPGSEDDAKAPRERLISDETLRPESQGPLEDIESARRDHRRTTESGSRRSARLSVRFEGDADNDNHSSNSDDKGPGLADDKPNAAPGRLEGLKGVFRLTPQRPVTSPISEGDSNITTSFLDLSGSNSNSNSDSSQREPSLISRGQGLKSRWSATTGTDIESHNLRQESSDSQNSGGSASSPSSNFPFPVSLPASPHHPEGFKPSPPVSPSGTNLIMGLGRLNIQSHPFGIAVNPASPSDSVPISISDLRFRHSDSENDELSTDPTVGSGSHLPPHPPLPGSVPPTPTFPPPLPRVPSPTVSPSSPIAALSSPSYIVSRVFPHSRYDSTADPSSTSTGRQAAQDKFN